MGRQGKHLSYGAINAYSTPPPTHISITTDTTENSQRDDSQHLSGSIHERWSRAVLGVTTAVVMGLLLCLMVSSKREIHGWDRSMEFLGSSNDVSAPTLVKRIYKHQRINHFDPEDLRTWSHPYFVYSEHFGGPGHPVIVKLGGESPAYGHLYPYITKHMAREIKAYVIQTEHRFYGKSEPLGDHPSTYGLEKLFTPEQALEDYRAIIRLVQSELGCSHYKSSPDYCPIITVGGSYPGCLAAIFRIIYPDVVDIAYAASAPMILNAHRPNFDSNAYYEHVTEVAERAWPGCANGVKSTLMRLHRHISTHKEKYYYEKVASQLGICRSRIPKYMRSNKVFANELTQLVVNTFGDMNMDYYPPSFDTMLVKSCIIFTDRLDTVVERMAKFLRLIIDDGPDYWDSNPPPYSFSCFDLFTQMPIGPNATISCADWTGCGSGLDGARWEFQVCKDLVTRTGYGRSMFYPPRNWTLNWLTEHCQSRFKIIPEPGRLNGMWHFDSLQGLSQILFTNGVNDGWYVGSFTETANPDIAIINYPNGAHHSDLTQQWPRDDETPDVTEGREHGLRIIKSWLYNMKTRIIYE